MFSKEERVQYDRHFILDGIGEKGQEKLKKAKILVIGAGGLGCPILQYLTAAGVGNIGIIDHDIVDQSNLQRQILYSIQDIGSPKVVAAANRLQGINPFVRFEVFHQKLTKDIALELFNNYDIIVDGSDNFPTRYLANDAAVLSGKPLVYGAIFKYEGQVSVFNYKDGPNYRCLFPEAPEPNTVPNCSEIGVLGVLPGIIGALQANEVLKIICGIGEVLSGKLLTFDALKAQQYSISFSKNESNVPKQLEENYAFFCGMEVQDLETDWASIKEQLEDYLLLDVRTPMEREQYHLGGIHIPLQELALRYTEIPKDKPVVVYCKAGVRSQYAISFLKEQLQDVQWINLTGGILEAR